jgi:hypothetical protein
MTAAGNIAKALLLSLVIQTPFIIMLATNGGPDNALGFIAILFFSPISLALGWRSICWGSGTSAHLAVMFIGQTFLFAPIIFTALQTYPHKKRAATRR